MTDVVSPSSEKLKCPLCGYTRFSLRAIEEVPAHKKWGFFGEMIPAVPARLEAICLACLHKQDMPKGYQVKNVY